MRPTATSRFGSGALVGHELAARFISDARERMGEP
jgi:hypothetical protein